MTKQKNNNDEVKLCSHGCGKEAKYYIKNSKKWQCENNSRKCNTYKKLYYDKLVKIVDSKGGRCLFSIDEYLGKDNKNKFECRKGHVWEARAGNVEAGHWCRICRDEKAGSSQVHNIEMLHEKARQFKGKCLSKVYKNSGTKYEWECDNGHYFLRSWNLVKNKNYWCPYCNNNLKEQMCRFIFEQLTGFVFNKKSIRVKNKRLELDGYCEELKLAFEYNGEQHYHEIGKWMDRFSLKNQQKRD